MHFNGGQFNLLSMEDSSKPIFVLILFTFLFISMLSFFMYTIFKCLNKKNDQVVKIVENPVVNSVLIDKPTPTHVAKSSLLEDGVSNSPKWDGLYSVFEKLNKKNEQVRQNPVVNSIQIEEPTSTHVTKSVLLEDVVSNFKKWVNLFEPCLFRFMYSVFNKKKNEQEENPVVNSVQIEEPTPTHVAKSVLLEDVASNSKKWVNLFEPGSVRFKKMNKKNEQEENPDVNSVVIEKPEPTHVTKSVLLEDVASNSPKWENLFEPVSVENELEVESEKKKKRKKKGKKSRKNGEEEKEEQKEEEVVCAYPFTTTSSITQRKIKQHYDELIKSHGANGLTLAQMGQFVNCLVEARSDLKHKSEIIQRKFTITKALLLKADRSSLDRLSQKISKLELEHKRVEEDVLVYNWLQQQLKLSPAYKKMLEIGECMKVKAKTMELTKKVDDEFSDISFEELLEQEKKDSFWQKNGKPRSCSG